MEHQRNTNLLSLNLTNIRKLVYSRKYNLKMPPDYVELKKDLKNALRAYRQNSNPTKTTSKGQERGTLQVILGSEHNTFQDQGKRSRVEYHHQYKV